MRRSYNQSSRSEIEILQVICVRRFAALGHRDLFAEYPHTADPVSGSRRNDHRNRGQIIPDVRAVQLMESIAAFDDISLLVPDDHMDVADPKIIEHL